VIQQAVLEEYRRLKTQVRRLYEVRARLLDLLAQGAVVEPGCLTVEARRVRQRRLTARRLAEVLGDEAVEELMQWVGPTDCTQLIVRQADPVEDDLEPEPVARPRRSRNPTGPVDPLYPFEI
jgi:hypothetical protein